MKKTLFALVLGLVVFPVSAFAAVPAGCQIPPDHAIYNENNDAVVGCIKAAVWDAAKLEAQVSKTDLPKTARGVTVTDEHGISDTCSIWYYWGCVNIFGTEAYRSAMKETAKQLISKGYTATQFPSMKGWMDSVR